MLNKYLTTEGVECYQIALIFLAGPTYNNIRECCLWHSKAKPEVQRALTYFSFSSN